MIHCRSAGAAPASNVSPRARSAAVIAGEASASGRSSGVTITSAAITHSADTASLIAGHCGASRRPLALDEGPNRRPHRSRRVFPNVTLRQGPPSAGYDHDDSRAAPATSRRRPAPVRRAAVRMIDRFTAARPRLLRLAYSQLGDLAEAEDVVQEAWLRLERTGAENIRDLDAWLTTTVARLALDALRSARVRRTSYVGPWLPEPVVATEPDPADRVTLDEIGQLRAADRARAAHARRAHRVRAPRRLRRAVRRGRPDRRPHAGSGAPARLAGAPARLPRAATASGLGRRAPAAGRSVRARHGRG